ncbi:hemerythrin domain-containing protein [Motiliproteus sp. SC1-56]|uniref:hemerythrin domain-containing protein n=1 Tax=Motiliproteus sp. SC1-56 TaxID=2799565 RepID=UPI001A905B82|nr:hemerythrin domain-containing protein [Motiliproteus sp. SC1-56]
MSTITDIMTHEHRHCDDLFTAAEGAASEQNWAEADGAWTQFRDALLTHLAREETVLFPAFESQTGQTQGPTAVMRMEHQQMRALVEEINEALRNRADEEFLGLTETLMVLMQQHNMKEEQILYPMSDQVLVADSQLLEQMRQVTTA